MVSTVTVSTVSTVTTAGLAASVALVGILLLFALLLQKELSTASTNPRLRKLGAVLNIGILPLFIAFVMTVIAQFANVIR